MLVNIKGDKITAKQLIAKLKKLPPDLQVGIAAHDNAEWEAVGWPHSVYQVNKEDYSPDGKIEEDIYGSLPDKYIVLHC